MAQAVKCLLCKGEDLNLGPRVYIKKFCMCWHMLVIPEPGKWRQADPCVSLVFYSWRVLGQLKALLKINGKKRKRKRRDKKRIKVDGS